MKELLDKKVIKIELNSDNTIIVFTDITGEKIAYLAVGDCCSSSWFYGITGIYNLLHKEINKIEDKEIQINQSLGSEQMYDDDELQNYGITLLTDKGYCDIEYRNLSNGYYGGYCEKTVLSGQEDLREIKDDVIGLS